MALNRTWIWLALAVVGLAIWIFAIELPGDRRVVDEAARARALLAIEVARVDTLRAERGLQPWTVVRRDDGWWLVEPIEEKAEDRIVESVLTRLVGQESQRVVVPSLPDSSWTGYGLAPGDPGRVDLVLASRDGGAVRILVGNEILTGQFCYLRRDGSDALELGEIWLYDIANSTHHGFRRASLFHLSSDDIVGLSGVGPSGRWEARLDTTTGLWWSGGPGSAQRLKRWILDDLALAIGTETVSAHLRDGIPVGAWAGYGLDRPWAELRVHDRRGESQTLWLGNEAEENEYFARLEGLDTVLLLRPSFVSLLDEGVDGLVDTNPIPFNLRRAQEIRVADDTGRWVTIRRTEGDWVLSTADGEVASSSYRETAARTVARGLEDVQPRRSLFVPRDREAASELDEILVSTTIRWEDRELDVHLGRRRGDPDAWMWVEGDDTLHAVDRAMILRFHELVRALHTSDTE